MSFLKDSLYELLDVDGRLATTIKTLLLKPGVASRDYSKGKQHKYSPPLRFYLVVSVIFFLVFESFQHVYANVTVKSDSITELYSRAMFVLFPLFALIIRCFYRTSYYLGNLVFSMHMHSIAYVVLLLIGPLESIENLHVSLTLLQVLPSGYFIWYFYKAFKTMYQQSWGITLVKATAIYMIYMAVFGVVFDFLLE
jgi:hypothetical protein